MQHHDAVVRKQLGTVPKEGLVEIDADMLEHADRDDAIELALDVAVVLQQELGCAAKPAFGSTDVRGLPLLDRQRYAGDIGAQGLGEIETKAAPATSDIEHAMAA